MKYKRLCAGLADPGQLLLKTEVMTGVKDFNKDYYMSLFDYNETHFKAFKESPTVAGITDVTTNTLLFDFDNVSDIEAARVDAVELCSRLAALGIKVDEMLVAFSGHKGFTVEIHSVSEFTPIELKRICLNLGKDLKTLDTQIYNASRIVRVHFTKHQKSGLYKVPLTLNQLSELSIDAIKEMAKHGETSVESFIHDVVLPEALINLKTQDIEIQVEASNEIVDLDLSAKPKNMPACKFALLHGIFKPGQRSQALMALAAHFKSQGYPKEVTYRLLKGARELNEKRYPSVNSDTADKNYIWNNIIEQVYGPHWKGATYACKDHAFLQQNCPVKGTSRCGVNKKEPIVTADQVQELFTSFCVNMDKNIIKTGLKRLDDSLILSTSMSVGLLGAPGSGKTSLALEILANVSKQQGKSLFCSFDMGYPLVFAKMASNVSGYDFKKILNIYKNNLPEKDKINKAIKEKYGSFPITFKSGQGVPEIKELILAQQEKLGEKIKLVVIDYLECIVGPYSDPTQNSAFVAQQLKDLSTELELCVITLVQPPKSAGDASKPLTSMRQVKGSSVLEQSFRAILSVYREGFSPNHPEDDMFITINCLKNTLGPLFSLDYKWHGLTGSFDEMSADDEFLLEQLRNRLSESAKDTSSYD